ncbi:hypothetical protein TcasGA2_TC013696 [Tribolium castaneum]|uniref:Uncharacterized protein n=1 Tax=Tribolium castaneum TaxID=7070 RepID=D6WKB0_TRICA|nr:hypothetical protein TcasGA2_TC013696 [Tribolium castaneum]
MSTPNTLRVYFAPTEQRRSWRARKLQPVHCRISCTVSVTQPPSAAYHPILWEFNSSNRWSFFPPREIRSRLPNHNPIKFNLRPVTGIVDAGVKSWQFATSGRF